MNVVGLNKSVYHLSNYFLKVALLFHLVACLMPGDNPIHFRPILTGKVILSPLFKQIMDNIIKR